MENRGADVAAETRILENLKDEAEPLFWRSVRLCHENRCAAQAVQRSRRDVLGKHAVDSCLDRRVVRIRLTPGTNYSSSSLIVTGGACMRPPNSLSAHGYVETGMTHSIQRQFQTRRLALYAKVAYNGS